MRVCRQHARRRAFTVVELLVVIGVIGLLLSIILAVSSGVLGQHKAQLTRTIMDSTLAAVESFEIKAPLAGQYGRDSAFGNLPPYQLAYDKDSDHMTVQVKSKPPGGFDNTSLAKRLARDLFRPDEYDSGTYEVDDADERLVLASTELSGQEADEARANDDIRALYIYLATMAPDVLDQIPNRYKRSLIDVDESGLPSSLSNGEFINVAGTEPTTRVPILGIVDAWDVPLDYVLYVKLEYKIERGDPSPDWYVTDRKPALRSLGVTEEVANADGDSPDTWIWSEPLPKPWADVARDGRLPSSPGQGDGGWVRLKAAGADYGWLPKYDD